MKKYLLISIFASSLLSSLALGAEPETKAEPAQDHYTIIHAGTLLAEPGKPPLERQSLLIKNNLISAVKADFLTPEDFGIVAADTVDMSDRFVLPGLMDMHVHLTMSSVEKPKGTKKDNDAYRALVGVINAEKTINAGYTTVRDVGADGQAIFVLRDAINRGEFPGPRIIAAGNTLYVTTDESYAGACYSVESCRKAVRKQIDMGAEAIKVYVTCSGSKPCGRENAPPLMLDDELKAIVETAATRELKVAAHAHGTAGIIAALNAGVASVEHGSYNDKKSHALFKKHHAYLVPTLSVEDNIARDHETATGAMKEVMEGFMANHPSRAAAAHKAGVMIAAGSDAGVVPHGENAHELEWYVKIGLTEMEAITSATRNGADLVGMADKLGSLTPGKYADIIATPKSPLENISNLRTVVFVMKDGQIIRQDK